MIRFALALMLVMVAGAARADELRPGYIAFTQSDATHWTLVWKAPIKAGITPQTQPILPKNCTVIGNPTRAPAATSVVTTNAVICSGDVSGLSIGLSHFAGSQTDVLVRVAPLGRSVQALRLTPDQPMARIIAKPDFWQVAKTYFLTGVDHILFGYDHLLFVVAMVLLLGGPWSVAKAVTAFTIAHSLTLIGTTLGFIGLPQRPVESVIALSILFLAVEIIKKDSATLRLSQRVPWVVAFGFGLLHGFGFAGALKEIGLPQSDLATALLTFNLGVEAGQLFIVITTAAILHLLRRFASALAPTVVKVATYGIGTIAAFWFIERSMT